MSAKINRLLVKVSGAPAGHITTRRTGDGGTRYSFTYLPDAGPEQALSVTMPVRDESYATWQMPPALEMSLPEGALKAHLENRFARIVSMDPMGLLFVTGKARIGNITAELPADNKDPELAELGKLLAQHQQQQDAIDSDEITRVSDSELESLFERLLDRYAISSGVGGVQPKVLGRTMVRSSGNPDKMALRTPGHIVKTSDDDLPFLCLNEHLCLKVAMRSGLDVPRRVLSDNGEVLILERFDIKPGGHYQVEDGCVLLGKPAKDRYEGSMERLVGALLTSIPDDRRRAASWSLFTQVVINTLVRNGDAHLKNFAILYDSPGNARLTKVFDITTTAAYDLFGKDLQAITLNGTRNWPSQKDLIRLGRDRCKLEERECREIMEKVITAVTAIGKTIPNEIVKYSGSEHILGAMLQQWNGAIKSLRTGKPKEVAAIKTELDETEQALLASYGDPYLNQKDRKDRLRKTREPQRTVMYAPQR
ncbi:MAG: type II toxin-antitoxin system HipA family toxin [Gammaproteobacteria bacterium]|nr:type II toxin-antitoxin system HipA family toxin [Gammaproteobacteria bacterium]